jgi:hypothetical protein
MRLTARQCDSALAAAPAGARVSHLVLWFGVLLATVQDGETEIYLKTLPFRSESVLFGILMTVHAAG